MKMSWHSKLTKVLELISGSSANDRAFKRCEESPVTKGLVAG